MTRPFRDGSRCWCTPTSRPPTTGWSGSSGWDPGRVDLDERGRAVHGELQAGDGVIWLHPEQDDRGMGSPRTVGATTASMAVVVDDVDAHYRRAAAEAATIVQEPVDQPYGYRAYSGRDLEGHLWSFMKAID